MTTNARILSGLAVAAALLTLPSCEKKEQTVTPPEPVCRISTMTIGSVTLNLTYDSENRLKTIFNENGTITYTYAGNMVTRTTVDENGVVGERLEMTNNAAGLPTLVKEYDQTNTLTDTYVYTYNAENQVQLRNHTSTGSSTPDVDTFHWENGNMVSINSDPAEFSYYTDQATQQGDYLNILQLFDIKYIFIKNKNLAKTIDGSNILEYSFNADGYITSFTSGGVAGYNYTYICK